MGLSAALILQLALLTTGADTYAEAHRATTEKGYPLVVMVGATWCPACQQMKNDVIPEVKRQGILQKVAFAEVDLDEESELGAELTSGGPIPQLVMYRKTPLGWRFARLIGHKDVRTVEKFIAEAVSDGGNTPRPRHAATGERRNPEPAKIATAPTKPAPSGSGTATK